MPIALYLSAQVQFSDPQENNGDPWWRNCLNEYVTVPQEGFTEYQHPARRFSLCFMDAAQATHDAAAADPRVVRVSPIVAQDLTEFRAMMRSPLSAFPQQWRQNAQTFLEERGFSFTGVTLDTTFMNLLRRVIYVIWFGQKAWGKHDSDLLEFIRRNLDEQVSTVPVPVRNRVQAWMQERNLDTSWISGTTTVREVIEFIRTNFIRDDVPFAGEVF